MDTINSLIIQNINDFIRDFEASSRKLFYDPNLKSFVHPGEFGLYREKICRRFLRPFVPSSYEIGTGFLVNNNGRISTQCDLIIYDKEITPLISDYNNNHFFTVESVVAVGEVKSVLTKKDLKKALNKLSNIKQIRDGIKGPSVLKQRLKIPYSPPNNHYDNIVSFLICEKFDFDTANLVNELAEMYDENVEQRLRHNMILSINDGLFTYFTTNGTQRTTVQYPTLGSNPLKNLAVTDVNRYIPIKLFSSYLFNCVLTATVMHPDLVEYLGSFEGQSLKYEK